MANEFDFFENSPFFYPSSSPNFPIAPKSTPLERFLWEVVDKRALIQDIANSYKAGHNYLNYHFDKYYQPGKIAKPILLPRGFEGIVSKHPFGIVDKFRVEVSSKSAKIEVTPYAQVVPNKNSPYAEYRLFFVFEEHVVMDGEDILLDVALSIDATTGAIEKYGKKFKAIQLKTSFFWDFENLMNKFDFDLTNTIKIGFDHAFKYVGKEDYLGKRNLYWQAPRSYLDNKFSLDNLYDDLLGLLELDRSWLEESNQTMLKVLELIASKDGGLQFLYNKFNYDPWRLKTIYNQLDGTTKKEVLNTEAKGGPKKEKVEYQNRTVLASLMLALCSYENQGLNESRKKRNYKFRIGGKYRVDSNVGFEDSNPNYFDLRQEKYQKAPVAYYAGKTVYHKGWFPDGERYSLHPLDIVTLITKDENYHDVELHVPAIFIKDIAYHREWGEISKAIRIGIDILVFVLSAVTLVTGAGFLFTALAVVDLGIAGTDLTIQAFEKEIRKMDGGPEFLDAWEKTYLVAGIVTGVAALPSLIGSGAKLMLKASSSGVRDQLKSMVKYSLQKVVNFPKFVDKTLVILSKYSEYFTPVIVKYMHRLANEGVLLIQGKLLGKTKTSYFLNYKGVMIAKGEMGEISKEIQYILTNGKISFKKYLDELYYRLKPARGGGNAIIRGRGFGQELEAFHFRDIEKFLSKYHCDFQIGPESGPFIVDGYKTKSGYPVVLETMSKAYFITDGRKWKLVLREKATVGDLLHELMHFRHCKSLGKKRYLKLGGTSKVERLLIRERYVFDKMVEYERYLTRKEMENAVDYMNYLYYLHGKETVVQFNISTMPNKRPQVSINKILNLK